MSIRIVPTPNPDALMFRVEEALVSTGTYEFASLDDTADAPLAATLLGLDEVELLLIAPRFVTVRKRPAAKWTSLLGEVERRLCEFLESGEMAVFDVALQTAAAELSALEQRIVQLLDEDVRPALAQDGGDLTYEGFEDGMVRLRLIGACESCPSSLTTLKMGIERLLMEEIPEVLGVEQVL